MYFFIRADFGWFILSLEELEREIYLRIRWGSADTLTHGYMILCYKIFVLFPRDGSHRVGLEDATIVPVFWCSLRFTVELNGLAGLGRLKSLRQMKGEIFLVLEVTIMKETGI